MLGSIFLKLTSFESFRRLAWRPIYEFLARFISLDSWRFMNYGYAPIESEAPIVLEKGDEEERYPLQLYHYLAVRTEIKGKDVLEVGSGRGGGSYYIARYLHPKTMTGVDLARNAIAFSNKHHHAPPLRYLQGNAEKLPFPDAQFDVVINVESSHAYGDFSLFLSEVKRVLRPGGIFLITDMRHLKDMPAMKRALANSGMVIDEETDITDQVVQAIELDDDIKIDRINRLVPKWMGRPFKEFAGISGSAIHLDLKHRSRLYYRWKLIAKAASEKI